MKDYITRPTINSIVKELSKIHGNGITAHASTLMPELSYISINMDDNNRILMSFEMCYGHGPFTPYSYTEYKKEFNLHMLRGLGQNQKMFNL